MPIWQAGVNFEGLVFNLPLLVLIAVLPQFPQGEGDIKMSEEAILPAPPQASGDTASAAANSATKEDPKDSATDSEGHITNGVDTDNQNDADISEEEGMMSDTASTASNISSASASSISSIKVS